MANFFTDHLVSSWKDIRRTFESYDILMYEVYSMIPDTTVESMLVSSYPEDRSSLVRFVRINLQNQTEDVQVSLTEVDSITRNALKIPDLIDALPVPYFAAIIPLIGVIGPVWIIQEIPVFVERTKSESALSKRLIASMMRDSQPQNCQ